jgi:hypothetical protein
MSPHPADEHPGAMAMSTGAQPGGAAPPTPGFTDKAKSLASDLAESARDTALDAIGGRKAAAAEQAEAVARLLDDVAGDAEKGIPLVAPYLRDAASRVHRVSSTLRERGIDELFREVGDFARRRPAFVIGACLAGGFALARFLKSSAERSEAAARSSFRAPAPGRAGMSERTGAERRAADRSVRSGQDEESAAALAGRVSPAGGMASLAQATPPPSGAGRPVAPAGTSAADGGSEAPDQGTTGRM